MTKFIDKDGYRVFLFVSRNKDNKCVDNYRQRKVSHLSNKKPEEFLEEFSSFVSDGGIGELSRFYVSVNRRDLEKTKKALQVSLIVDNVDITKLDSKVVSLSAKPENTLDHYWMFDFDSNDSSLLDQFIKDVSKYSGYDVDIETITTKNGYAVMVSRGFDTRVLLDKYKDIVTLKRDGMYLYRWKSNIDTEMV